MGAMPSVTERWREAISLGRRLEVDSRSTSEGAGFAGRRWAGGGNTERGCLLGEESGRRGGAFAHGDRGSAADAGGVRGRGGTWSRTDSLGRAGVILPYLSIGERYENFET